MFKEKIVEGLRAKSEIKRFGLSNEAIDRIATEREKTVTEESQVETVLTDAETMRLIAEELMKHRDQEITKRTEAQSAFNDYKAKHPEKTDDPNDKHDVDDPDSKSLIEKIQAAVTAAVTPLNDKIAALENLNSTKAALDGAREKFFGGDYAKKYKDEADDAWDRAVEMNEATGNKMTADELAEKATGYFNKAVSRKGVDTSLPFKADKTGDEDEGTLDWSDEKKRLQDEGRLPKDQ
jgi:hypothetical protein